MQLSGETAADLDSFLRSVEVKALALARFNLGSQACDADALDIVQEAMIRLAARYADKAPEQWSPLFYRILHNRINDWHRRRKRFSWLKNLGLFGDDQQVPPEALEPVAEPDKLHQSSSAMRALQSALDNLPERQRQVFLLRCWQQYNTRDSALALGISEGSVKTHYSRALQTLREHLGDYWP